jgi:hypothetical protein
VDWIGLAQELEQKLAQLQSGIFLTYFVTQRQGTKKPCFSRIMGTIKKTSKGIDQ